MSAQPVPCPAALLDAAVAVLKTAEPQEKIAAAQRAINLAEKGAPLGLAADRPLPPDRPSRPARPPLVPPTDVPRRRLGSEAGRAALLHAIGHIEFNAIDLAFDMAARFAGPIADLGLDPRAFVMDWISVGVEEARHFDMICRRLAPLGAEYGCLPAHDGLWEAAEKTTNDLAARLAVAPLILEARGLDVTPGMIDRLEAAGDQESAAILSVIYEDEIGHVACGERWFHAVCIAQKREPAHTFQMLKEKYFSGMLKPPFNHKARDRAGLPRAFYEPN